MFVERAEQRPECLGVVWVAENEAIHPVVQKGRYACKNRGYDRQAAGHRFGNGHPERILPAGTDVEVSSGIGVEYIRHGRFPETSVENTQAPGQFAGR